jgi:hypothetical protein
VPDNASSPYVPVDDMVFSNTSNDDVSAVTARLKPENEFDLIAPP